MSNCQYCNKDFFDKRRPNSTSCPSCRVSKRRWKSKLELVESLGGKCSKCGYNDHPAALHFHHKNPKDKLHEINSNKLLTKDRNKEIKKCTLLCANCHAIEHSNTTLLEKFNLGW